MSDSEDLVGCTTASHSHSNIDVLEPISTYEQDGLVHLQSEGLGFNESERFAVDLDESISGSAHSYGGGVLLSSESLHLFLLYCSAHCCLFRYALNG